MIITFVILQLYFKLIKNENISQNHKSKLHKEAQKI